MEKVGKIINSRHFRGLDFSVMASVSILNIDELKSHLFSVHFSD